MMTRTALLAPAALLLALSLVGCGAQSGRTLVQYEKNDTGDRMTQAFDGGLAALYSGNDLNPEVTYLVEKGDRIGFRDDRVGPDRDRGSVVAVAGDNELPIAQGTVFDREYYWKLQREEED